MTNYYFGEHFEAVLNLVSNMRNNDLQILRVREPLGYGHKAN